jgi:hypothetical protein
MNRFVNFRKRSIELPKGCKDLSDVLKPRTPWKGTVYSLVHSFQEKVRNGTCDYCGGPAVGGSMGGGDDLAKHEAHFWCEQCARDLAEFHSMPENAFPEEIDFEDAATLEELEKKSKDVQRRETEFMRQKVAERKRTK